MKRWITLLCLFGLLACAEDEVAPGEGLAITDDIEGNSLVDVTNEEDGEDLC